MVPKQWKKGQKMDGGRWAGFCSGQKSHQYNCLAQRCPGPEMLLLYLAWSGKSKHRWDWNPTSCPYSPGTREPNQRQVPDSLPPPPPQPANLLPGTASTPLRVPPGERHFLYTVRASTEGVNFIHSHPAEYKHANHQTFSIYQAGMALSCWDF